MLNCPLHCHSTRVQDSKDSITPSVSVSHIDTNISGKYDCSSESPELFETEEEELADGSKYSMRIVRTRSTPHMREVVLFKALLGIPANQARSKHPGFSQHHMQVQIITICEAKAVQ